MYPAMHTVNYPTTDKLVRKYKLVKVEMGEGKDKSLLQDKDEHQRCFL